MTLTSSRRPRKSMLVKSLVAFVLSLVLPSLGYAYEEELDQLATELAASLAKAEKTTLAVVDFTDVQGDKNELGRFLAEELSVALVTSGHSFRVIDRAHLNRILEESRLGESGIVDQQTAQELGKIIGVDVLVTGTLTPLDGGVRLAVKVLDTETAMVIAGARHTLTETPAIRTLLARGLVSTGSRASSSPANSAAPHTKAYDIESQESGGLRVTARAMRLLQGGAASVLEITNISSFPLRVGLTGYSYESSTAIDNRGNFLTQSRGLEDTFSCNDSYGLALDPGQSQQIMEVYGGAREPLGDRFTISILLRVCKPQDSQWEDGKVVQFSFSDLTVDPVVRSAE